MGLMSVVVHFVTQEVPGYGSSNGAQDSVAFLVAGIETGTSTQQGTSEATLSFRRIRINGPPQLRICARCNLYTGVVMLLLWLTISRRRRAVTACYAITVIAWLTLWIRRSILPVLAAFVTMLKSAGLRWTKIPLWGSVALLGSTTVALFRRVSTVLLVLIALLAVSFLPVALLGLLVAVLILLAVAWRIRIRHDWLLWNPRGDCDSVTVMIVLPRQKASCSTRFCEGKIVV